MDFPALSQHSSNASSPAGSHSPQSYSAPVYGVAPPPPPFPIVVQQAKKSKAGRKIINEDAPNKRIAQNRSSQRAYQERKAARLRDLETRVEFCQTHHSHLSTAPATISDATVLAEVEALRARVAILEAENARLSLVKAEAFASPQSVASTMNCGNSNMSAAAEASMIIDQLLMPLPMVAAPFGVASNAVPVHNNFVLDPLLANPFSPIVPNGTPFLFDSATILGSAHAYQHNGFNIAPVSPNHNFNNGNFDTISRLSSNGSTSPLGTLKSNATAFDKEDWDLSKLDCLDCAQRAAVNREMLKSIKSLRAKENGVALVDELCDLMENFSVKCRECESTESNKSESCSLRVNSAGVPSDQFSVSLLKVVQTRFKVLEACDNEDDRERIIDLLRYSRRKNTFVRKNFGRILTVMRQALSSIVDPLVAASSATTTADALSNPVGLDLSASRTDSILSTAAYKEQLKNEGVFDLRLLDSMPILEQANVIKGMLKSLKSFKGPKEAAIADEFVDVAKSFFECQEPSQVSRLTPAQFEAFHRDQVLKLYRAKLELMEACKDNSDRDQVLDLLTYTTKRSDYFQKNYDRFLSSLRQVLRI
ncbi:hypothetical protein BC830DRAFT_1096821 [Chytriomyces sp. MP71]|nr:hypothetical protein BC830DRAFT_1096821 [Chytriomyces sp. MP71]